MAKQVTSSGAQQVIAGIGMILDGLAQAQPTDQRENIMAVLLSSYVNQMWRDRDTTAKRRALMNIASVANQAIDDG